jgi:hypothetical protein
MKKLVALLCFILGANQLAVPQRLLGMLKRSLRTIMAAAIKATGEQ